VADDRNFSFLEVERLEHRWNEGADSLAWDAQGWIGGDYDMAWFKTEGESVLDRRLESAEV
jgi:copper resistance protein B